MYIFFINEMYIFKTKILWLKVMVIKSSWMIRNEAMKFSTHLLYHFFNLQHSSLYFSQMLLKKKEG